MQVQRDEDLALAVQKGHTDAFALLVERHQGRVYRTLYAMIADAEESQDLAQEVFLKVYRALRGYRGDAAFTTWLHRLTVNTALDFLRSRKRRPLQVPLEPPEEEERPAPQVGDDTPGPEDELLLRERRDRLAAAVHQLSEDYRQAVMLYHFYNLSYQEIAERLEVPVRTIETRLYRARAQLKRILVDEERGGGSGLRTGAAALGVISG